MKKLIRYSIVIFLFCLAISCTEKGPQGEVTDIGYVDPYLILKNQSGHTVSIVLKPTCIQLPDSLILDNGKKVRIEMTSFSIGKLDFFDDRDSFTSRKIYYDGRHLINFKDLKPDRDFSYEETHQLTPHSSMHSFALTEEDYRYAVEHGADIGADQ